MNAVRKRQKTEATAATDNEADVVVAAETSVPAENAQALKELEVGITEFVTADNEGFSGILKKRYELDCNWLSWWCAC